MGRAMFGPEVTRFAALRKAMEDRWIPEMQRFLSIADHELPLLWDADFLFRPGEAISDGSYALCEINARALLQRLAAVRGRLSLCADQAAAAKWWLSMPMASVSAEGPMPKALSTRPTSPLMQIGRAP